MTSQPTYTDGQVCTVFHPKEIMGPVGVVPFPHARNSLFAANSKVERTSPSLKQDGLI